MGADAIQVFTQSPRAWRSFAHQRDDLEEARARMAAGSRVRALFCHATYLINLATSDATLAQRSLTCLRSNLAVASAVASSGLVLHVGSHLGEGLDARLDDIASALRTALDGEPDPCPILLENTAGAGGTIGRRFEELAEVVERLGGDPRIGICLDTQHLWAAGVPYSAPPEVKAVVQGMASTVGLDRLRCVHLNDSKVPFASNRDRHANLGEGAIGSRALGLLVGHPSLSRIPAVLEVPGAEGRGAGKPDVARARRLRRNGARRWAGKEC